MRFLKRCWYMAGWAQELAPERITPRTIAGQPLVLFRDERGAARALEDRCPHRFAPLHLGRVAGGRIRCGYHGLEFDGAGACVRNPYGDGRIPPRAQVRRIPLEEAAGVLWVWLGPPGEADPASIPDFGCLAADTHYVGHGYMAANADYRLETDNIMDLSHIEFLHPGTLGSSGVSAAMTSVDQEGTTVWSHRQTSAEILPAFLAAVFGIPQGEPVDRRLDVRWDPPASMLIDVAIKRAGRPDHEAHSRRIANIFSPETERRSHYWYAVSYERAALGPDGAEVAQRATDALRTPFETEDLPMIEAVQREMGEADFWSLKPLILAGDAGAVLARRTLDRLIAEEAASADVLQA